MLRLRNLQVDVPIGRFDQSLAWWSATLGGTSRETDGIYTHLDGVRARVGVHLQRLGEGPPGYHLDLEADDVPTEVDRLVAAGATDVGPVVDGDPGERVLRDPAGLSFCIAEVGQPQHLSDDREEGLHLRVLLLDVPAAVADAEAAFWATALGVEAQRSVRYPSYTGVVGVAGPGGPTNLYVQATGEGPARLHVDLHCADEEARDAAVRDLTARGAAEVDRIDDWVVLEAPGGQLVCVVPDQLEAGPDDDAPEVDPGDGA